MKQLLLLCVLLNSCLAIFAQATDLVIDNQTPGWLSSKINYGDQQTVRNLKVTGYVNANDVKFIGSLMEKRNLRGRIDLSESSVVASDGNEDNSLGVNCFDLTTNVDISALMLPKSLHNASYILGYSDVYLFIDSLYWNTDMIKSEYIEWGRGHFCNNLILGDNVTTIPETAFGANICKFKSILFSKHTKYIGSYAFFGCTIEKTNIGELDELGYLGDYAFRHGNYSLDSLIIPKSLIEYHVNAFNYRDNEHIFISSNTTIITGDVTNNNGIILFGTGQYGYSGIDEKRANNLSFHMESKQPPHLTFQLPEDYSVYVPKGAKSAYMQDMYWNRAQIIEVENPLVAITFDVHELSLEIGGNYQIKTTFTPENADDTTIIWKSDNQDIVSVSEEGIVEGKSPGHTIIRAISTDGLVSDTCKITVIQHVTGIRLSQSDYTLKNIGETVSLLATVLPENSTNKEVKWGSTNESVCTVEKGVVIATGYGTAVITATSIDGGYTAVCVVNVVHDVDGVITKVTTSEAVNAVYDLQGHRVMAIDKGLYIKNGMKFFK